MQRTGSILVIENEPTTIDLILDLLTDAGYVTHSVPDGSGALNAVARHPPALMLVDMCLPDMSSAELIAQLYGADPASIPIVPIVLMTTMPRKAAPLLVRGLIECLAKPFDIDDLLACVARYVQPAHVADPTIGAAR